MHMVVSGPGIKFKRQRAHIVVPAPGADVDHDSVHRMSVRGCTVHADVIASACSLIIATTRKNSSKNRML